MRPDHQNVDMHGTDVFMTPFTSMMSLEKVASLGLVESPQIRKPKLSPVA